MEWKEETKQKKQNKAKKKLNPVSGSSLGKNVQLTE